ncbi:MAG TPA: Wss1p-related putative metallopeptidase [Candidatus Polarisedimenticolaceae bacterium]|nr:Wss1p-related putative metallopeptidase [Candidatus Polarisedimenticolaceae bacterium]
MTRSRGDGDRPAPPRLFDPEDLKLRRSGEARLIDLARLPSYRPPTERAKREEEDRQTMGLLRSRGAILAAHFGLQYAALEAEADGVVEHYGICYRDGLIRIRLRHATSGRILKESSLVDTLCHELAHLKVFDHSLRFRRFYLKILDEARERGWYKPGPAEVKGPIQGSLFDGTGCGTHRGPVRAVAKKARGRKP